MHATRYPMLLAPVALAVCLAACLTACTRAPDAPPPTGCRAAEAVDPRLPSITVSGDESGAAAWNWQPPRPELTAAGHRRRPSAMRPVRWRGTGCMPKPAMRFRCTWR